jgi:ArsR family transcriptional regulator, arsenate/arsenite/antimonite-responsive transcriptional repressor
MEDLIGLYKCLCDATRLRILNLLMHSPLCVCHIQHLLGISQVNASRHLKYLKARGLVQTRRHQNWTLYALPVRPSNPLHQHLACLQDLRGEYPEFQEDLAALHALLHRQPVHDLLRDIGCPLPSHPDTSPQPPQASTPQESLHDR